MALLAIESERVMAIYVVIWLIFSLYMVVSWLSGEAASQNHPT
jgi:succinate-acetate transporter protein